MPNFWRTDIHCFHKILCFPMSMLTFGQKSSSLQSIRLKIHNRTEISKYGAMWIGVSSNWWLYSLVKLTTCFHEFSKYESTNLFYQICSICFDFFKSSKLRKMVFFTIGILAFERPFLAFAKYILTIEALPILRKWYFFTKIVLTYCEKKLF